MRIGIDARLWGEPRSGIGRYTRSLIESLLEIAPDERLVLYQDRVTDGLPAAAETRCLPWRQRLVWTLWAAARDLRRRPVDLFHGVTGFELPRTGVPLVTTVHDLIPLRFPRLVPRRHRWAVRCLLGGALRRARRVIAVSGTTRDEIRARYGVPAEKIHVVPEAAARHFAPPPAAETARVRARYGLDAAYVLFVGLLEPKKNVATLLDAVARLVRAGEWGPTRLVVAGAPGWGTADLAGRSARLGIDGLTRWLGPVADADLPALYAGARAFVFPSAWEGFGLPVLEAMASGAAVIASRRGALPELVGDAGVLVDPEAAPLADALGRVLGDPALRDRLRERGLARAADFSWARTAAATLAVYREARG